MVPSDCRYGGPPKITNKYSLYSLQRLEIPYSKCHHKNLPETFKEWVHLLSLRNLRRIIKIKALSFLLGLLLTSLIVASYILTWDRKGFMFTTFQLRPMVITTSAISPSEPSSENNLLEIKLLVKRNFSKLEYTPRIVPDERTLIETDPQLFSVIPRQFLPNIKSSCWHEEFSSQDNTDPYERNMFTLHSKTFRTVCDHLATNFQEHLYHKDGKQYRLRCLPFFYIVGQPKCGTTDLFQRLLLHPEIKFTTMKEPHWWTRKRFGYIRFKDGFKERFSVDDYLDLFDLAAQHIQEGLVSNSSGDLGKLQVITGEASASTMWDNQAWSYLHSDREEAEPLFLALDFIHAVQPNAKIIVMLRDPVERLYSDYLYFKMANKSAEDFHRKAIESVRLFQACLSESHLHSCVYNTSLSHAMPVRLNLGMYIVFLLDWLTVFHREQILVLPLEVYAANIRLTMNKVFAFLSVGPLSDQALAALTKRPMSNTRREADRSLGPMLSITRDLLRQFHQPFNLKLASLLNNQAFLWTDT